MTVQPSGISEAQTGTRITRVRTVLVSVSDQDSALRFYNEVLGFSTVIDAAFGQGQRWIEVAPPGAATSVALVSATPDTPAGSDTGIRFSTTDAEADHAYLSRSGVDVDAEVARWPGVPAMFSLRDPDGNRLFIVEAAN